MSDSLVNKIEKIMVTEFGLTLPVRILKNYGSFCDFMYGDSYYSIRLTKTGRPKKHSIRKDCR